jgi:ATP-dependent helicase/DNAse subunit B
MNLNAELTYSASKLKFLVRETSQIISERVKQHQILPSNSEVCQDVSNIAYLAPAINAAY